MSVTLAKHSGFCFGVKRATETAEALADTGGKIYYNRDISFEKGLDGK